MNSLPIVLIAAAFVASLPIPAVAGEIGGPATEAVATARAAIEAGIAGDIPRLMAQYAPACTFVDEFAPFFWSGTQSIEAYFAAGGQMYQQTQHKGDKVRLGPPAFVYVSGDRAFVVEPLSGSATVRGEPYASSGSYAFTLARIDGGWKITSQTWTKARENMNPY